MTAADRRRLLGRLSDTPRWSETRGALLGGEGELFGSDRDCIVRIDEQRLLSVVGEPGRAELERALAGIDGPWTMICSEEAGARWSGMLPEWRLETAFLHVLTRPSVIAPAPAVAARIERVAGPSPALLDHLSPRLRREIAVAAGRYPMFAAWVGGRAVAFCYAASVTESFWDVSVETLAAHRRTGLAAACVAGTAEHLARAGKRPVWGAVESNEPSLRLAAKLGFRAVDRIAVLEKDE